MAASRIFIKGLPPTFTEAEFRKHFSQPAPVTDAKIFQNRRIGYVGYKTHEDAQKAVKYFNKTFIRMSRIGVELASPKQDESGSQRDATVASARKSVDVDFGVAAEGGAKRKRDSEAAADHETKLKEFLEAYKPKDKKSSWEAGAFAVPEVVAPNSKEESAGVLVAQDQSDDEYEAVPAKRQKRNLPSKEVVDAVQEAAPQVVSPPRVEVEPDATTNGANVVQNDNAASDLDWARSRTSRLLGLLDDDEEEAATRPVPRDAPSSPAIEVKPREEPSKELIAKHGASAEVETQMPTPPSDRDIDDAAVASSDPRFELVRESMRLFVRNLSYDVKAEDLKSEFASFGNLEEVHVPLDHKTGSNKGFAYLQFSDAGSAERALSDKDAQIFQGRLLHVLPAKPKRETKLDDFALSKLPLKKQQQIKKRRDAASVSFNWNALYMNADAVISSVADRLGLSKSEVLDPTSSDAAIKQAHAETHIIQETKAYFKQQGIDLDSFKRSQRGDTAILVKNIPYDCSKDELQRLFEEHGETKKFLMPPSGTLAVVEFANAAQCKAAFGALAYRKIKSSVLFLEKAPQGLFDAKSTPALETSTTDGVTTTSAAELRAGDGMAADVAGSATLFVRNLNFDTTSPRLTDIFSPLDGFLSARVKTRTDPKKPGQVLSMGFGFLEFRSLQQAQAALKAMDGYSLDGHKLQIRASHKGADAAEERRKADAEKRAAGKKTKVVIKNLPFEASKKDIRALFGAYGQLRSVRVPKKMDRAARGFAFADFTTPKEAESAMDALKDTHLLGRRLVLDFAAEDPEDAEAEIEKMQQKVGAQVNKVALQKLTSTGRKKFNTQADEDEVA